MSENLIEVADFIEDMLIDPVVVNEAYERFWNTNQLGIDKNGKKYRTDIPRKRPKYGFADHNFIFGKKDVKIKVVNDDELI